MWGRLPFVAVCVLLACTVSAAGRAAAAANGGRDDTAWLQAKLDAGGDVFLPKLPGGECYRTRGLWVSRDGTSITSDGACLDATGRGEARFTTGAGIPVRASALLFVNHSRIVDPLPVRVTISGLRLRVPRAVEMDGISVAGHEVSIERVTIEGAPRTDVVIGGGSPGSGGMSERIAVRDSVLSGGRRNVVSVFGPMELAVERNTLSRARGEQKSHGAGLLIAAGDRGQPTLDVRVTGNTIVGNAGPGILLDLAPRNGAPVFASGIDIYGNRVLRNAAHALPRERAGIVIAGGQRDGRGTIVLSGNVMRANHGRAVLRLRDAPVPTVASTEWMPSASVLAHAGVDDTSWLQRRLDDGGGTIFLPRLSDGRCYATRGLWVSHDDTTITSDGACIVSLGPGEVRLHSIDGDPIAANGVFFVNRSNRRKPTPVNVTISNLGIAVPSGQAMYGIAVFGHEATVAHVEVGGAPIDDVLIGGRANGNGYVGRVAVLDSTLTGAGRNAISAFGVFGLRVEGNTIAGVRDAPPGQPGAGIDVEPDERSQPTVDVHIVRNTISDNAGPGILLSLESNSGPGVIATDIEVAGNTIVRNGQRRTPPVRAGIVISGGQDGGAGTLALKDNVIRDNRGPGVLMSRLQLVVDASGNDVSGNDG